MVAGIGDLKVARNIVRCLPLKITALAAKTSSAATL
jgi:hypothetical protein